MNLAPLAKRQALAFYIRTHLIGASGGIRLAELLAADPWTCGAIDHLPAELAEEVAFARTWAAANSNLPELWAPPLFSLTKAARKALSPLRPLRGRVGRAVALESMRSLVLAKKAMWELGVTLETSSAAREQLVDFDIQATRQARELQALHQRAAREAFSH